MNGHKNGSANRNRGYRNFKLSPTTRAIRSALALSAAMLALSGTTSVYAANICGVSGLEEVSCNGTFNDDVSNYVGTYVDLTLIVGNYATTTVDPAAGVNGISSYWGGTATVINYAEINVTDADGIHMSSNYTATVENYGDITATAVTSDVVGVSASATYDVTVVNDGNIDADASGTAYNATGIYAHSVDDSVSVTNYYNVSGTSGDGTGTAIYASAWGDVTITNDGLASGNSDTGNAYGISTSAAVGDSTVTNNGTVEAYSNTGTAYGISSYSWDGVSTVNNYGTVNAGGYDATGIDSDSQYDDASINNEGDVYVRADAYASGLDVTSQYGNAAVTNSGSVYAYGYYGSYGASVVAYNGTASITNDAGANLDAGSYYQAVAAYAYGYDGASISNDGSIYAGVDGYAFDPTYGFDATGAHADAPDGDASISNSGYIGAAAYGYTAQNDINAIGAFAESYNGNASISNASTGTIYAYAGGYGAYGVYAIGAYAQSENGDATLTNAGSIGAVAYGYSYSGPVVSYGAGAISYEGDATVSNTGTISATSSYYGGQKYGIFSTGAYAASYNGDASVTNSGLITADTSGYSKYGLYATGATVFSVNGDATVTNNGGTISATVTNDPGLSFFPGYAIGVSVESVNGDANVYNTGEIDATVHAADAGFFGGGNATGVSVTSDYGYALVDNSGTVNATVDGGYGYLFGSVATGISADGYAGVSVYNSGVVTAAVYAAPSPVKYDVATGINAYSYDGNTLVDNSGTVDAIAPDGNAYGVSAISYYGNVTVDNSGSVGASSEYNSYGVIAGSPYGDILVDNSGTITSTATGGTYSYYDAGVPATYYYQWGQAVGVVAAGYYAVDVDNSGLIDVDGYAVGVGVVAYSTFGDIHVDNGGTIDVYAGPSGYYGSQAIGITVDNIFGYVYVDNSGDLNVNAVSYYDGGDRSYAGATATGIQAHSYYYVSVNNSGNINVSAYSYNSLLPSYATGINAEGFFEDVVVNNSGTLTVSAESGDVFYGPSATGVQAYAKYGDVTVSNSGDIEVTAQTDWLAYAGAPNATGVYAVGIYGDITVNNGGTISATSYGSQFGFLGFHGVGSATAVGVNAVGVFEGYVEVNNTGDISANAIGGDYAYYAIADATGVNAMSYYNGFGVSVYNEGAISANASVGYDSYYSSAIARGVTASNTFYDVDIYNGSGGSITATASAALDGGYDNQADAYGISTYNYYGDTNITNFGSITATASAGGYVGYANATGIQALVTPGGTGTIDIYNDGSITATAQNHATGIVAQNYGSGPFYGVTLVSNGGDGEISASASGPYNTSAIGVEADGYYSGFYNEGAISASAEGDYNSVAYGTVQHGAYVGFDNYGTISADASGYVAFAAGSAVYANYSFSAYNGGSISASASGDFSYAAGFVGVSYTGSVELVNAGTISASADLVANGVFLASNYYTEIWNYGLIEASADVAYAINTGFGASEDYIYNAGTITGGIYTGYADDFLYNAADGVWNAGEFSYFGYGDDQIWNYGVINMDDSVIDLGLHAVDGNYFYNYGTINVNGAYNVINMGDGPQFLVPSLNPNAFYNGVGGTIDFQDGDPDDVLVIIGDFAGDGDINVDVSGLDEVSDVLYIDGSVVTGTAGVINVDLLDLPDQIEALIPIVYVTGNSVSGNFVLGEVNWDDINTFVTLDFDIVADIDASNATPDVFALGIEVTGLSDPGTLAASVPGSVLSLMNSSVGTWRQRMGVIDHYNDGAFALWARIWTDKGGWSPDHSAVNFGNGGNFDWDQKNSGFEAGVDFAVTDEFSIGLLVGKSQAKVDLADPGHGSSDIDADTWGIYGTWISPTGFYLDASYRWMNFDADLDSVAGPMQTSGDSESFNVEVGYAWTMSSGLKIEPQFQYTKSKVDNIDAVETTTGMVFANDGGDSSRGRLGVSFRKSFGEADAGWMWTPYVTISGVREFDGETNYAINDTFFGTTDLGGSSALLELGFTATHQNWSIYGGLNWEDGGAVDNWFGGQLGVRYTFGGPAPVAPPPPAPPAKTCADLDDDGDGINNCDDKCVTPSGEAVGPDGCPVPPPAPEPAPEPKPYRG